MATLDPKDKVLQLLYPQPSDGTGPGYISALDVQTATGNLYDQVARVNDGFTDPAVWDPITGQLAIEEEVFTEFLNVCVDPVTGKYRSYIGIVQLVQAMATALAGRYPTKIVLQAGSPTVLPLNRPISIYSASLPVNWATGRPDVLIRASDITLDDAAWPADPRMLNNSWLWWNGARFQVIASQTATRPPAGAPPTTGSENAIKVDGDPWSIVPEAKFSSGRFGPVPPADLYTSGMRGVNTLWLPAGSATNKFYINDLEGRDTLYKWVPQVGHATEGTFAFFV